MYLKIFGIEMKLGSLFIYLIIFDLNKNKKEIFS